MAAEKAKKQIKQPVQGKVAKVPVIMQMEALECGAACLTMVLSYYEKWIPLEQVRVDCGVSRDGSNAKNILKAARNYGLDAAGYRMEPEDIKKEGLFPAIIHWNFNHFVVLNGFKGDKAYLNDPARGSVTVSMKEFDESFTGICLMFEPTDAFVPEGKPKSMLSYAKERLKGTAVAVAFVVLTSIITSLLGVINPVFSRIFIDRLLPGVNPSWAMPFLMALAGFAILQIATMWINAIYSLKINGKLAIVGSSTYMWKILHLPMEFYSQRMAG
ncbi:MAG: NHLP family bacteriocin export ABC transporter peptidase/permease/ATPase, partial [Lachnospiraceae bacterium]|nr:NHLP family bacteriocin export ABC transporter peptidase/permease/ATPase [Lachnospiraceae bacterium]